MATLRLKRPMLRWRKTQTTAHWHNEVRRQRREFIRYLRTTYGFIVRA